MTVRFLPSSETQSTLFATFQKGPILDTATPPYITVPSGTTAVQGTTTGSAAYPLGQGSFALSWYLPGNANATVQWQLDDEQSVDDAIQGLMEALEAESQAVDLASDGTVSVAS